MTENREIIRNRMAEILTLPLSSIEDQARLADLVPSSFLLVELIIDLQEEFEVRFGQAEMRDVNTVGQLLDLYTRTGQSRVRSA